MPAAAVASKKKAAVTKKVTAKKRSRAKPLEDVTNGATAEENSTNATRKRTRTSKRVSNANDAASSKPAPFAVYEDPKEGVKLKKEDSMISMTNEPSRRAAAAALQPKNSTSIHTSAHTEGHSEDTSPYQQQTVLDPLLAPWYTEEIFRVYQRNENAFHVAEDYLECMERDINAQMRGILIDWIVEVGEMYNLQDQTIYLCTNYLDRYVAKHIVPRSNLQLVGVTCLQIAAKFTEVHCPTGEQFSYISVTPVEDIMRMERKIIDALDYRLCVVSALDFCMHFARECGATPIATQLAKYFLELTLQDYGFLSFSASTVAATAVKIALWHNDGVAWSSAMAASCKHDSEGLRRCSEAMKRLLVSLHESTLPAVKEKYSHSKYLRVSQASFEELRIEEDGSAPGQVAETSDSQSVTYDA